MSTYQFRARRRPVHVLLVAASLIALSGCSALGGNGPSAHAVRNAGDVSLDGSPIQIVDFNASTAFAVRQLRNSESFSAMLGNSPATAMTFAPGDTLAISIYEAPPAVLFGPFTQMGTKSATAGSPTPAASQPSVIVDEEGYVDVPFVGRVLAAGRGPVTIATDIRKALIGKANSPQVIVSEARNTSRTVTVLGETGANLRVPLTLHGERLLDILASGETLKQPVDKTTIQIARDGTVASMPLSDVITDPDQNIRLRPGDVVTALYKPYSFTALGSVKTSKEIEFEATGINLAQALGRAGGLDERNADVRGVFVFRFEDPALLPAAEAEALPRDSNGRVPVIYRLDMSKGASLLLAQQFAVRDKDVIYVSRAPAVDLQNFVGVTSQLVYTLVNVSNGLRQ